LNIEHPMITEINRYGYPKEYLWHEDEEEQEDDEE